MAEEQLQRTQWHTLAARKSVLHLAWPMPPTGWGSRVWVRRRLRTEKDQLCMQLVCCMTGPIRIFGLEARLTGLGACSCCAT
jgi:hypothetical protein